MLVTGAGGLIGGAAALRLSQTSGLALTVTARRLLSGYQCQLPGDLLDAACPALTEAFDWVVHCAAAIPGGGLSPEEAAEKNARLDGNVLEACIKHGSRLVYVSAAAYDHFSPVEKTEEAPLCPMNAYQAEKLVSEKCMLESGVPCAAARVTSPYGRSQQHMTVMKRFVLDAVQTGCVTYFGAGNRTQDFIHVSDIARAVAQMITLEARGVYNIGSGTALSMKQLAEGTAAAAEKAGCGPVRVEAADRADPQEAYRALISIGKAQNELDWRPEASMADELTAWCGGVKDVKAEKEASRP